MSSDWYNVFSWMLHLNNFLLFNKLIIIASYNMIKMGGVIQRELTRSVLKISGVINCFYLLENLYFCLVHVHVYDTRC